MTTMRTQPNQPPNTGVHDSSCTCSMCAWVTSRRQRPLHITMDLSPDAQTEWTVQHLAQLRAAMLRIMDDGRKGLLWDFAGDEQRMDFCDAVQRWIVERCK